MKDFINKLELAFDKQLEQHQVMYRQDVKELFLRACIEVLADNKASETPSKEESEIPSVITQEFLTDSNSLLQKGKELTTLLKGNPNFAPKASILRYNSFAFNEVENAMFIQYRKAPGNSEYMFEIYGHDMEFLVEGWTSIDNPSEDEMIQLYLFYKDLLPF